MGGVLHWVVALPAEAKPIIDRFSLKRVNQDAGLFPIYESEDGFDRLVISGIGKASAAAATAVLAEKYMEEDADSGGWINFGIAGSGRCDFAEVFLASRITDRGSGRSWYPPAVWPRRVDLPRREVMSVDRPEMEGIHGDSLIEMEATGFYPIAIKAATSELCQVVKVVSDDPDHSVREIRKEGVISLCEAALEKIDPWLEVFRELAEDHRSRNLSPPGLEEWKRCARFSVTQVHQLRRLLQQWDALRGLEGSAPEAPPVGELNSRECLRHLRDSLKKVRSSGLSIGADSGER